MFGKNSFILAVLECFSACLIPSASQAFQMDFSRSEHYQESVVPSGWVIEHGTTTGYAYLMGQQPYTPQGSDESGLYISFYNQTIDNLLYCTNKVENPLVCDTVLAKIRFYAQPQAEKVDSFQIVASTNAWKSYFAVGRPLPIEEQGRKSAEWVTYSRSIHVEGLSEIRPDFCVGILMSPGGRTKKYGYIKSLNVDIAAAATPRDVCLKRNGVDVGEKNQLVPGDADNVSMSVFVSPDPNDDRLTLEGVYGVVDRNGTVTTNKLIQVEGTDEYKNSILAETLDAGEVLNVSSFTKYATKDLPTAGVVNPDGYAYEDLDMPVQYVVSKVGSVWINELSAERVEICGTTNRALTSGWTLVVADGAGSEICRAPLGDAFNFAPPNMINGVVGIDVRDLAWSGGTLPTDDETYLVSLCNSRGIVEHTVRMVFANGTTMGQSGYAKWPDAEYAYDWAGTATDGTFSWKPLGESSFGRVNEGQGFNVPVTVALEVNTGISYAAVVATVSNINNSVVLGTTTDFSATSIDGVASLLITGCTPFPTEIHAVLSGTAFGWSGERKGIILDAPFAEPESDSLVFTPTVASDDFSEFADYWRNEGTLNWVVKSVSRGGRTGNVLRLDAYSVSSGTGFLKCQNYLSAHGRGVCAVAFDYCNTVNT